MGTIERFPGRPRKPESSEPFDPAKVAARRLLDETKGDPDRRARTIQDLIWFKDIEEVLAGNVWDFTKAEHDAAEQKKRQQSKRYMETLGKLTDTTATPKHLDAIINYLKAGTTERREHKEQQQRVAA